MTTPIRAARADAMWLELSDRADVIDGLVERVGDDDTTGGDADDWREVVATATQMTGSVAFLATFGPRTQNQMSHREADASARDFGRLYALNVTQVTAQLRTEAGWSARQVDVALDDLVGAERIRLVAEPGGFIRIEVLRRHSLREGDDTAA